MPSTPPNMAASLAARTKAHIGALAWAVRQNALVIVANEPDHYRIRPSSGPDRLWRGNLSLPLATCSIFVSSIRVQDHVRGAVRRTVENSHVTFTSAVAVYGSCATPYRESTIDTTNCFAGSCHLASQGELTASSRASRLGRTASAFSMQLQSAHFIHEVMKAGVNKLGHSPTETNLPPDNAEHLLHAWHSLASSSPDSLSPAPAAAFPGQPVIAQY